MIDKLLDKIESYHVWRFIFVFAVLEVIGAIYLVLYFWKTCNY